MGDAPQGGMSGRLSPVVFRSLASEFLEVAERTFGERAPDVSMPAYFLVGRALELAFKSFLLLEGKSENQLKRVGHDLEKVQKKALQLGISKLVSLKDEELQAIAALNVYYVSKDLEYVKTGFKSYPDPARLIDPCRRILSGLQQELRRWRPAD